MCFCIRRNPSPVTNGNGGGGALWTSAAADAVTGRHLAAERNSVQMSFHHQQSMEHLIERLRSPEGSGLLPGLSLSRSNSRRGSLCDSPEENSRSSSSAGGRHHHHQGLDNPEDSAAGSMVIDPEEEDEEIVIVNANTVCSSCQQAESQTRQVLSVQQARQR